MSEASTTGRQLPRALTPFRHSAYRRLAVALTLSTFASGVWVVGLVWEVIRIDGGPAQLSVVSTCLLYTSPSPRDGLLSRMPSSA